jgi:Calcineurin-like phosphoesterase
VPSKREPAKSVSQPVFSRRPAKKPVVPTAGNDQLYTVPQPLRDPHLGLDELVGAAEVTDIIKMGMMQFQATGDTGVGLNSSQPLVAHAMARDINTAQPVKGPSFFLNLGDVIYGNFKKALYANNFYRPNAAYQQPAPGFDGIILAIPGNHDGEVRVSADDPSLSAFQENFVQPVGQQPPMAKSFGVKMPNQPGVYFHLDAPFVDLIALDSNAAEDFGTLGKDATDTHQATWLQATLTTIKASRTGKGGTRKALLFAMHHPPYARGLQQSGAGHPGSPQMQARLDAACAAAGIWPDAVLSGHSHNYQRYKRTCQTTKGQQFDTAYFVVGTGGIALQSAPSPIGAGMKETPVPPGLSQSSVVYQNGDTEFGFVRVGATGSQLLVSFVRAQSTQNQVFETVTIDLSTQRQVSP